MSFSFILQCIRIQYVPWYQNTVYMLSFFGNNSLCQYVLSPSPFSPNVMLCKIRNIWIQVNVRCVFSCKSVESFFSIPLTVPCFCSYHLKQCLIDITTFWRRTLSSLFVICYIHHNPNMCLCFFPHPNYIIRFHKGMLLKEQPKLESTRRCTQIT